MLSPCLVNLYAEYIMQNAELDEAQAGIKIAGRNSNNLRHADDTTLMYSCHLFLISSAFVRSLQFLSFIEPIFA